MDQLIGTVVDNYRIVELLGKGGMGVVYKAIHITLDQPFALKFLHPAYSADDELVARLKGEARLLAQLASSENIVRATDIRPTDHGWMIVMDFIDGETLADRLKREGALPWQAAFPIFQALLAALIQAHAAKVIHRDLKPGNVLLSTTGQVLLTDFGLAKSVSCLTTPHSVGRIIGTPEFMSPEQFDGLGKVDERSDIYSLGMTFYKVLAGRTPFTESDSDRTLPITTGDRKFAPASKFNPQIPPRLDRIVGKAINKKPGARYQSATDFLQAITEFSASWKPTPAWRWRRPLKVVFSLILLLALGVGSFYSYSIFSQAVEQILPPFAAAPFPPPRTGEQTTTDVSFAPITEAQLSKRPAAQHAYLVLNVIPSGAIFLDQEKVAPGEIRTTAGTHRIRFLGPTGANVEKIVTLEIDERQRHSCYFESTFDISVRIGNLPSWGQIWIDQRPANRSAPTTGFKIATGNHTIEVRRMGYQTVGGPQAIEVKPSFSNPSRPLVFRLQRLVSGKGS